MEVFQLDRFVTAQNSYNIYEQVLHELRNGKKMSHWIWYIFPQQKGLGKSFNSEYYGLDGVEEAKAYLAHPVLGNRLRECCQELLKHKSKSIKDIMGSKIDVIKLRSCMILFSKIEPNGIFDKVKGTFFYDMHSSEKTYSKKTSHNK